MENWLRSLVWMDYRLALLLTVIVPLALLVWAFVKKAEAIQRLLVIYWRVASLLMIVVYLMIFSWPYSFILSFCARILIPVSLWFWVDINEEIREQRRTRLRLAFSSWRWAATLYSLLGAIALVPFFSCAFTAGAIDTPYCRVWLEAPLLYKQLIHPNATPGFLGFLGFTGLFFYGLFLLYFLVFRLGKQGRTALEP
ncbi:MAG: DUF3177 family protein [Chloroflexaceae bacterium]|nr:DUF3177 family protein [Chloroflexaceae bacterium]